MSAAGKVVGHAVGQAVRGIADAEAIRRAKNPAWWWFTRILIGFFLLVGWIFILWQNKFHVDVPVVVVCLGYLAVVFALANLWRVGAAAVGEDSLVEDSWARPLGQRDELDREKRTLLRSIKEAEFDREMGKLSKVDADELIRMYRARAIEVIKELDRMDGAESTAETPRQAIERELAARVALEQEQAKGANKAKKKDKGIAKKAKPEPKAKPAAKAEPAEPAPAVEVASAESESGDDAGDDEGEDAPQSTDDAVAAASEGAAAAEPATKTTEASS